MADVCIHLDPYAQSLTVVTGGTSRVVSYQEALGTARIADCLSNETITTICKALVFSPAKKAARCPQ